MIFSSEYIEKKNKQKWKQYAKNISVDLNVISG